MQEAGPPGHVGAGRELCKRALTHFPPGRRRLALGSLHCTALHCTARHGTARHCTALHCTTLHCMARHGTASHCILLWCTALPCLAVPRFAQHCCVQLHVALCYPAWLIAFYHFRTLAANAQAVSVCLRLRESLVPRGVCSWLREEARKHHPASFSKQRAEGSEPG